MCDEPIALKPPSRSTCNHESHGTMALIINPDGSVKNAIEIPGNGNEALTKGAEEAAMKWKFKGTGQEQRSLMPMTFCDDTP